MYKRQVLVLHGDQQNAAITLPYWQPVKQIGYALAAAQSTELQVSDGYLCHSPQPMQSRGDTAMTNLYSFAGLLSRLLVLSLIHI